MTSRNRLFAVVTLPVCAAILLASAWFASAGDLNPPVGPVAPTHKTLTEVEPRIAINATNTPGDADSVFRITQPGSYYLTSNVPVEIQKHGVKIGVSRVTIDLNGFAASGSNIGAFDGVTTTGSLQSIEVLNGTAGGSGDAGVDLGASTHCRVRGVQAVGNGGRGILTGTGAEIVECSASGNGNTGITVGAGSAISRCVANGNNFGFSTGQGCAVSECVAYQNTLNGISVSQGSTISQCCASDNGSVGINANTGCTVVGCSADTNGSTGISGISGTTVSTCSVFGNASDGISVTTVSSVVDCTARANALDGIRVASRCVVRGNTCGDNGSDAATGAGVHATGNDNRIEDNNCTGGTSQDRGIDVDGAGNIIIKNTCSGNTTDWDIAANNVFGPIIDRRAPASAAVSGFTAASSLGSTEPNANFSY